MEECRSRACGVGVGMPEMIGSVTRERHNGLVDPVRDRVAAMSSAQWRLSDATQPHSYAGANSFRKADLFTVGVATDQAVAAVVTIDSPRRPAVASKPMADDTARARSQPGRGMRSDARL